MNDYESWSPRVSSFPPQVLHFLFFFEEVCGLRVFSSNCSFLYKAELLLRSAAREEVEEDVRESGICICLKAAAAIDVRVNPSATRSLLTLGLMNH